MIRSLLYTLLLTALCCSAVSAQNVSPNRKYRVIAYKKGDNTITSMSNTTEVTPNMSMYIPNSFTPNGDGLNDTFGVYGEAIKNFKMQVFNRWGQLIFESSNVNVRWDGVYDGIQVPQGSYVYRVTASGVTGKNSTRDGTVTVVY